MNSIGIVLKCWNCFIILFDEDHRIYSLFSRQHLSLGKKKVIPVMFKPVLRIQDILVRIRIRGSMPLTSGSRSGFRSCYFRHWFSRCQQKTNFLKSFSSYFYFLKIQLPNFSKIKVQKMCGLRGSVPMSIFWASELMCGRMNTLITSGPSSCSQKMYKVWRSSLIILFM